MLLRAFTAWIVTFNFRGRRIATLFHCSFISCYYSSRENRFTRRGRNSHSCADSPPPYLSFASCTLCIISRSFSPRNAYYPARLSGRLPSRFQSFLKYRCLFFFSHFLFFSSLLFWEKPTRKPVYLANFNKTVDGMLFLSHDMNA